MKNLLLGLFLISASFGFAQTFEVGAWVGGTNSFNDVNTNTDFLKSTRPAGGILGKYNFNERIAAELMVSAGRTYSTDADLNTNQYELTRNEATRTTAIDFALSGEFNFKKFSVAGNFVPNTADVTPYLSAGIGASLLDVGVYSRLADNWVDASTLLTEDEQELNSLQVNVPLAAGVKYKLNHNFVVAAEYGARLLFTDYYDNISTVYNQTGIDHTPGLIDTVGRQRGDSSRDDVYNLFGLQLTYIIPTNSCPKFN